jgi:hypothetical protein
LGDENEQDEESKRGEDQTGFRRDSAIHGNCGHYATGAVQLLF